MVTHKPFKCFVSGCDKVRFGNTISLVTSLYR
jgi:hypothetical protein